MTLPVLWCSLCCSLQDGGYTCQECGRALSVARRFFRFTGWEDEVRNETERLEQLSMAGWLTRRDIASTSTMSFHGDPLPGQGHEVSRALFASLFDF